MGSVLEKGSLFPVVLVNEMVNLTRGKSAVAKLSASEPVPFNGKEIMTFTLDAEADLVAEGQPKSNGGATIGTVTMQPLKLEYGMRINEEFDYAAEEVQLRYLQSFAEGFGTRVARALDIMAFHGKNPRSRQAATTLAGKNFDDLITNVVTYDATAPQDNVEAAINLITSAEHEVNGMAMSPAFKSDLAGVKTQANSNVPLFPELGWGNETDRLNGLAVDSNSTVSFDSSPDKAIVGNFRDFFKWGISREIPIEIIRYGNPDNSELGDLKGRNQIYVRGETYVAFGILVPGAFSIIKTS